jgi:DNA-directed RNA polymerase subunit L
MEVEVLKQEKNLVEVKIDNVTVAEILRDYLNKQDVEFAAWRREHPSKPAQMRIESGRKGVKKEVSDAVAAINKDLDKIVSGLKK